MNLDVGLRVAFMGIGSGLLTFLVNKLPGIYDFYHTWGKTLYWRLGMPTLLHTASILVFYYSLKGKIKK